MRYFKVKLRDAFSAQQKVWDIQDQSQIKRSRFSTSGSTEVSVWTEDPIGEALFRHILIHDKITYSEGDQQQVTTWLDQAFGGL